MGQTVYIYILVRYKWGKIILRPPRKILKYLRQETMKVETLLGERFPLCIDRNYYPGDSLRR